MVLKVAGAGRTSISLAAAPLCAVDADCGLDGWCVAGACQARCVRGVVDINSRFRRPPGAVGTQGWDEYHVVGLGASISGLAPASIVKRLVPTQSK